MFLLGKIIDKVSLLEIHKLQLIGKNFTDVTQMMKACELARQYDIPQCEDSLLQQLRDRTMLSGGTISAVSDRAGPLNMPQLELLALEKCCTILMLIAPSTLIGFSPSALRLCLSAAHLKASEASILKAVISWAQNQLSQTPNQTLRSILDPFCQHCICTAFLPLSFSRWSKAVIVRGDGSSMQSQKAQDQPSLGRRYHMRAGHGASLGQTSPAQMLML